MLYWILSIAIFFAGCLCGYFLRYLFAKKRAENPDPLQQKLQTYEKIIRSQEKLVSVGKMTAGIAHEVKNALTFVTNFSDLSLEFLNELHTALQKEQAVKDNAEIEDTFQLIEQNIQKMAQHANKTKSMIRGMLTHVSQEESTKSPTDIHQLIEEATELSCYAMEDDYRHFSVTIRKEFDDTLPEVSVIPSCITQVLINLLNNAYYSVFQKTKRLGKSFTPTIVLTTKNGPDNVYISVKDNGEGIPQKYVDTIFNAFSSTKPAKIGAGLGLSICWDLIVNKHQGTITVNTQEGDYAEFVVALPKR